MRFFREMFPPWSRNAFYQKAYPKETAQHDVWFNDFELNFWTPSREKK